MKEIISRLRTERQKRGYSLAVLAEKMDVSPAALGAWERGQRRPTLPQANYWASFLDLQVALIPADEPAVDIGVVVSIIEAARLLATVPVAELEGAQRAAISEAARRSGGAPDTISEDERRQIAAWLDRAESYVLHQAGAA